MSPMPAEAAQAVLTATGSTPPAATGMDLERCDRCGSRAYVMTLHGDRGLPLTWCKHHFERHSPRLADDPKTMVVVDVRSQLTVGQ